MAIRSATEAFTRWQLSGRCYLWLLPVTPLLSWLWYKNGAWVIHSLISIAPLYHLQCMYLYTSDRQPCMLFLTNNSTNGNVIGEIKTYANDWWKYIGAGSVWLSSNFFMRKAIYLRDLGCIPIIKIYLHWAFNVLENTNCRLCNCTVDFLCASYEKLHLQCQVMQCEASAMHTDMHCHCGANR